MSNLPHPDLQILKTRLIQIHEALEKFKPLVPRPPILDSSFEKTEDPGEENQWLLQGITIPGLRKLKEDIKIDLGILDKFLDDPNCANLPPISTNAPYVISVWNEVLCAPPPIVSIFKTFLLNPLDESQEKPKLRGKEKQKEKNPPGAKVDIIADNGRRWIRVNTIKNSRLHAEFCEIDSYLTDSDSDLEDEESQPSLAQTQFDNSVLRMGRSLLMAAKANTIDGTAEVPIVTLRLTRLDPNQTNHDGKPADPRIAQTLDLLRGMGVDVVLGERSDSDFPIIEGSAESSSLSQFSPCPTTNVNLDLSVLIALISDLTHSPLPSTIEEANKRFVPPPEYREWKQKRMEVTGKKSRPDRRPLNERPPPGMEKTIHELPRDFIKHAKALTNQLLQEMSGGMMQEIHDQLKSAVAPTQTDPQNPPKVQFWTTSEARDRCLRIVSKIGGVYEKRRVRALFRLPEDTPSSADDASASTTTAVSELSLEEAEELYWQGSRFPVGFIPFLPIHILPSTSPSEVLSIASKDAYLRPYIHLQKPVFSLELAKVCADILAQDAQVQLNSLQDLHLDPDNHDAHDSGASTPHSDLRVNVDNEDIQRARVTTANSRLTVHTVHCMQWGAELGWTTLTANRTSVKAILKELKGARVSGRLAGIGTTSSEGDDQLGIELKKVRNDKVATVWIVDPRSLAEGMSSQPVQTAS